MISAKSGKLVNNVRNGRGFLRKHCAALRDTSATPQRRAMYVAERLLGMKPRVRECEKLNASSNPLPVRRRLEESYRRLAEARQVRPVTAVIARFNEIDGGTLGALVSIQLFTTVIPLIILGFSYLTGFADNASPGTVFSRELGLVSPLTEHVRSAFGHSSGLRSSWTFFGVAGFLVWGIPMSITIAGVFAKAWRRRQFGLSGKLWRGVAWFALYLMMITVRERIAFGGITTLRSAFCDLWLPWLRSGPSGRSPLPSWSAAAAEGACICCLPASPAW